MCERLFKVPVITNDYNFLFKFALETDAYIEVLESDYCCDNFNFCCDSFNFCYSDSDYASMCQYILESIVQDG